MHGRLRWGTRFFVLAHCVSTHTQITGMQRASNVCKLASRCTRAGGAAAGAALRISRPHRCREDQEGGHQVQRPGQALRLLRLQLPFALTPNPDGYILLCRRRLRGCMG
jgi:hypothetical protein